MIRVADPDDQKKIEEIYREKQEHIFRYWNDLDRFSRDKLMEQVRELDFGLLRKLWRMCLNEKRTKHRSMHLEPAEFIPIPGTEEERRRAAEAGERGEQVIREGKVGAFLVAGGQGTRLGFAGPKGMFPAGPVTGKTLFEMHAEKIRAAIERYGTSIPWYIMTSETNDEETRCFFEEKRFFGIPENDICFFMQRMIPALDVNGKLILDAKDHIFTSPNGHGGSLLALVESGAVNDMKQRGTEFLSYFQVDNVLIKIIDPCFIGYHVMAKAEMSSKMLLKRDPDEKVGVFGLRDGRLNVIEYSDLSEADKYARHPSGQLIYGAGSIAIHLINVAFVEEEVNNGFKLPYHIAFKKIPFISKEGKTILPETANGYKFETFVFDALGDTTRSVVMEVERGEEFSPIKNREGEDSHMTAVRDLSRYFGEWLQASGVLVPVDEEGNVTARIEISPLFADSRDAFLSRWNGTVSFRNSLYIGPECVEAQ